MTFLRAVLLLSALASPCFAAFTAGLSPNLEGQLDRPLRYRPEGTDFVIENGSEFFNRPLYGGNTAFRVDAGDKPEFSLYLPGRGGNLRIGLRSSAGIKWLIDAQNIVSRYRPGSMIYMIRDPLLGDATLTLTALALHDREGLIVKVEPSDNALPVELVWAYGGVTGARGKRDGDIGTEDVPIGAYFQLKPEFCRNNVFELTPTSFTLRSKPAVFVGLATGHTQFALADAAEWSNLSRLLSSADKSTEIPVVLGRTNLTSGNSTYIAILRVPGKTDDRSELATYREVKGEINSLTSTEPKPSSPPPTLDVANLPQLFTAAEQHFAQLRQQITIDTPDPFLNAAAGALNVAADAVWDEPQGVVMHGAIAWRSKLLGWRGPYSMDALGWHDRARRHFIYWAGRQNTSPIPDNVPPADENANLARSEAALHSNGDLSNSHYDMNLVYIDALFRHLLWTGDLGFARQVWPVIERHLAWERRLFRREFTIASGEKLPLYEAYAAIWASDDLQYHGGGTAHASAYNFYHNKMAARLARLLEKDASPYEHEAELIARGMRELLWMPDKGMFAEFKDYLGLQRIHPSAALWTFYHTIDSEVTTPEEAVQMSRYVDQEIPHIPVRGPGVPENLHVLSTSNWMPYTWSINNVVMGEINHSALAFWQAGRADEAYQLLKSALTASMFMGISPGNVGSMNYLDVYRREAQRDFADGSGVTSRAIIEGLFGLKPDLLADELAIAPGFPSEWTHARLQHSDLDFSFERESNTDTYRIVSRFPKPVRLRVTLFTSHNASLMSVNAQPIELNSRHYSSDRVEFTAPAATSFEIKIVWSEKSLPTASLTSPKRLAVPQKQAKKFVSWDSPISSETRLDPVNLAPFFNDSVTQIFKNEYRSPRSPFASLAIPKQGIGAWAGFVNATAEIDDSGLRAVTKANNGRLVMPNGVPFATPAEGKNIVFTSQWDNYPREATIPLNGHASHIFLLMAGSTNWMQSRIDNGDVIVTYVDGSMDRLALHNPTTWWPLEQDYFIDDYQFKNNAPLPPRIDLKTGKVRLLDPKTFKGQGREVPGGAATALKLQLDPKKELRSLTVRTLSNEVVIGLMSATLLR
ncbi:MAG: DUF4450 domain-containing protein [Nibricoccus sp.]